MTDYGSVSKSKEYKSVEMIPLDVLWSIKHMKGFRIGIILCILFMVFLFLFFLVSFKPLMISLIAIFMITAISLNFIYSHTQKFADIVNALNMELTNVEVLKSNTLRFDTESQGKFFLYYDMGGRYSNAHYKMWIKTIKILPVLDYEYSDIWDENSFFKRSSEERIIPLPGYITIDDVNDISSIREIRFERGPMTNRVVAVLDDQWFYSETSDILKTLKILIKIEKKLK
jgi:hypothetical protein